MTTRTDDALVAWWPFEGDSDETVIDRVTATADRVEGNFKRVAGAAGSAVKLDGFTTAIVRAAAEAPTPTSGFTIEAWIAIGAYPWNFCPIAAQGVDGESGYHFAVGPRGEVRLGVAEGDQWVCCTSGDFAVPLRTWTHLACTCDAEGNLAVLVDGEPAGTAAGVGAPAFATGADLWIGANERPARPAHHRGEGGTRPSWFCLDGMLDELKIHARALSAEEIATAFAAVTPAPQRELTPRRMPSGPEGPGRFGAYYCKLKYYDEWDAVWPAGPHPDVVVRFDRSPVRVVFWRGTRYSPAWVSDNGLWMADQSVEAWRKPEGCFEHMQDRHCHYSHVRIIESTEARAVVHWRYAPTSSRDTHWRVDPKTGWGCWVDEYYILYPDAMGIRQVTWKTGSLGQPRQFQESLPLTQPGQVQGDVVEREYATVANLDGDKGVLCYTADPTKKLERAMPANAVIQRYNFKSAAKPFICFEEGNDMKFCADRPIEKLSAPGTCNHWPVCQARSDGRNSQTTDRPAHFASFPISYSPIHQADDRSSWHALYGMTEQPMAYLITVCKSWNRPPELKATDGHFACEGFDRSQRAYLLTRREPGEAPLACTLAAGEETPAVNPVLVLADWGAADVSVTINGRDARRGDDFRTGITHGLDGTELVLWLHLEATKPVELTITGRRNAH